MNTIWYYRVQRWQVVGVTGIDSPYEIPENPDIHICGYDQSIIDSSLIVIQFLENNNYI